MIRLTQHHLPDRTVIRLEGRLDARNLDACHPVFDHADGARLDVDLSGLTSIDEAGRDFLIRLRETGCRLVAGSLYISRLLGRTEP